MGVIIIKRKVDWNPIVIAEHEYKHHSMEVITDIDPSMLPQSAINLIAKYGYKTPEQISDRA